MLMRGIKALYAYILTVSLVVLSGRAHAADIYEMSLPPAAGGPVLTVEGLMYAICDECPRTSRLTEIIEVEPAPLKLDFSWRPSEREKSRDVSGQETVAIDSESPINDGLNGQGMHLTAIQDRQAAVEATPSPGIRLEFDGSEPGGAK